MPTINGNNQNNNLNGSNGADTIYGNGGHDRINGRGGHDRIDGGAGDDIMDGGAGNDVLISNAGNDIMTGGNGADTFVIGPRTSGTITITDFQNGVDRFDLTQFGFDSNGDSANWAGFLVADGANTILDFWGINGENFQIVLQNFDYTNIDITDYILGGP
jgi:Ca2+-binding RTX toxin-like protein